MPNFLLDTNIIFERIKELNMVVIKSPAMAAIAEVAAKSGDVNS